MSSVELGNAYGAETADCSDCGVTFPMEDRKPIQDLWERISPGEPVPAGECPLCGSLAHANGGPFYDLEQQVATLVRRLADAATSMRDRAQEIRDGGKPDPRCLTAIVHDLDASADEADKEISA